jgi:V8-like Glu-specific endopeptidase
MKNAFMIETEFETRPRIGQINSGKLSLPGRGLVISSSGRNFHHRLGQGVLVRRISREIEEEVIGDRDTRQKVDGTKVPFRWVCSLKTRFRDPDSSEAVDFDAGSGLLIGSQYVLTCAHNLYNNITGSRGTVAKRKAVLVMVYPGRNVDNDFPLGGAESAAFMYLPEFEKDLDTRIDYALIKLKTPIGDKKFDILNKKPLGFWGSKDLGAGTTTIPLSRSYLQDKIVNVGGYPNGKNHAQYVGYDVVNNSTPTARRVKIDELITYLADTSVGQSGAPVWRYLQESGKRCLVAVHNGACHDVLDGCKTSSSTKPTSNMGVLITTTVLDQLEKWKKAM